MPRVNIPEQGVPRIVIVGGGFAGLSLARKLASSSYQVVLLDKNNYHQFQPLFYQVAMAGLEPSTIVFPLRRLFQKRRNVFIRVTEVLSIVPEENYLTTTLGRVNYDVLILATGATTNYFGNKEIAHHSLSMKSVSEALFLRNKILNDLEKALSVTDYLERQSLIDIVIVGGGPTGVEVAGALAEMRRYILPKDYPELNCEEIDIYVIQSGPVLLKGMSEKSSQAAYDFLKDMGVNVLLNKRVTSYDGQTVTMDDGTIVKANKVIWAAGIEGSLPEGIPADYVVRGKRLKVDAYNRVEGTQNVFAIGDIAYMTNDENWKEGHPQVAQVAIQQGNHLAKNLLESGINPSQKPWKPFFYKDKGSMATIGKKRAVVDLPRFSFTGTFAWLVWLLVHLFSILGVKNKVFILINWVWNYTFYDQALRLIIKPKTDRPLDETAK